MSNNTKKDYTQLHIHASEHPKAYAPHILILNIVMSVLGAIIGLELIVRTGVAPNTSIVGALFAIIISRIPIAILKKYQSIHCQNLIQTSISGATFSAANCFLLPIGVPVIMGRMDLMYPMLIGAFLATIIDATILYKTFDTEMFPAEGAWPPGVASAESILAVVQKGKKALLLLTGMGIGIGGKMIGIPTDLLGVSWFGDFAAMAALGVGSIVIGIIKTNGFIIDIFGTSIPVITDLFGEGADLMAQPMFQYMPHGIMIGAGLISLIQCGRMLLKKSDGNSAAGKFSSSMANMKKALGGGYIAYLIVAVLLAVITGIWSDMSMLQLISSPGKITGGEVYIQGEEQNMLELGVDSEKMRHMRGGKVSMIFQEPMTSLNPVLTIGYQIQENIIEHLKMSKEDAKKRTIEMLKLVNIPDAEQRFDYYPQQFPAACASAP